MTPAWQKHRKILIILGLAAVLAALGVLVLRIGPLAPARITVTQVRHASLTPSVFGIGNVEARQTWLIGPTAAGRVLNVHVDVGDTVQPGQLLAEMDPVDMDQRLQAQDAALLKAASAQEAASAQVEDAQARRSMAHANLNRQRELAQQNFISASALEGREQELQSAEAALQAARANLLAAKQEGLRLRAEREAVLRQRQNTRLIAPAKAVVISRDAESGSTVIAGQAVLRLVNPASLWVRMRVDQGRSSGLASGLAAQIVLRSRPEQPLDGRVERVELQADAVTEERIAQVRFDKPAPGVSIGEMAEVTLHLQALVHALVVPQASAHSHQGQTGVWRLRDGKLEFTPVQWGVTSLDGRVQVVRGLKEGDTVVVYSDKPLAENLRFAVVSSLAKRVGP